MYNDNEDILYTIAILIGVVLIALTITSMYGMYTIAKIGG